MALDLERLLPEIERVEARSAPEAIADVARRAERLAAVMGHIAAVESALRQIESGAAGRYGPGGGSGREDAAERRRLLLDA